ncbi:MAG: polyketide synthase dehydratase domain-containing protein [Planctomycetaceae bacterium]
MSILDSSPTCWRWLPEKTGYPSEMLKPEMSLDHDLGIRSIKRVEILSALQERRPDLPAVKPEQLGTLHRLEDVIALLGQTVEDRGSAVEERKSTSIPSSSTSGRSGWERTVSLASHPYLEAHVIGGKAVLPTAMILECLAHAALHHHPGLEFVQADNLRIFKGVRIGRTDQVALRVITEKARREQGTFHIPAVLVQKDQGREIQHARADLVLAAQRPAAPRARLAQQIEQNLVTPPADWYGSQLFHGSRLQGLTGIEALSRDGIIVLAKPAPGPGTWLADPWRRDWIADPLAIDVALQAIIVWTQSVLGFASLPTAIGSYRQFRRDFPADGLRIAISARRRQDAVVVADAEILAADGSVVATLSEIEYVLDAQLQEAFRRNRVE